MNTKFKVFSLLLLSFTSLFFTNCEKEESDKIQNSEVENDNLSIKYVSGKDIPNIINELNPEYLSTYNSNTSYSSKSDSISDTFGVISVENIIETIDSLQNKNYSFTLTPKKPKPNSIFNLVVSSSNGNVEMAIMEYRMAPDFAQAYRDGTKSIAEFTGNILRYPFNGASKLSNKYSRNTCIQNIDEVVNCDEIIVDGGAILGSGGGGSTTIGSNYTYTGGDGGTVTHNYETSGGTVGWVCNEYHFLHSGPTNCGNGTGTWVIRIYPNSHTSKLNGANNRSNCCDGTNIIGYIPLNIEISPLQYLQSNLSPNRTQSIFLSNHPDIAEAIFKYQITNPSQYSPENIEFLKQLINLANTEGLLDVDNFNRQITSTLPPCLQKVLNDLKTLQGGKFGKVIAKFAGVNPVPVNYNWDISVGNLPSNLGGKTNPTIQGGTATTVINSNYVNVSTDLSLARTIIHECFHAYLVSIYRYRDIDKSYANLVDTYATQFNRDLNDTHHHIFAINYVINDIAIALKEYATLKGYTNLPPNYFTDMAWGGLIDTSIYKNSTTLSQGDKDRIESTLASEQYNNNNNTLGLSPKGIKPCP